MQQERTSGLSGVQFRVHDATRASKLLHPLKGGEIHHGAVETAWHANDIRVGYRTMRLSTGGHATPRKMFSR